MVVKHRGKPLDKNFVKAFVTFMHDGEEAYAAGTLKRAGPNGFTEKEIETMFLIPYNKKHNPECQKCRKSTNKCAKCVEV